MTTTPRDPAEIRRDIQATRADMDQTLGEIEDRVSPSRIRQRQAARMRTRWTRVRSTVMGDAQGTGVSTTSGASTSDGDVRDQARERGRQAADAVRDAPDEAVRRTQGNPLAAGTIAFGLGALIGSLMPSSEPEQKVATRVREELEEPVKAGLQEAAQRSSEELQPAAQEAAEEVRSTATEAAQTTRQEAEERAESVRERAEEGAQRARG